MGTPSHPWNKEVQGQETFLTPFVENKLTKLLKIAKMTLFFCPPNLLFHCGDTEANPGPKYLSLTFCHWNLNSLTAHHLSETFLNYFIKTNDD